MRFLTTFCSAIDSLGATNQSLEDHSQKLAQFQRFLIKHAHLAIRSPKDLLMFAVNEPDGLVVTEHAKLQRKRNVVHSTKVLVSPPDRILIRKADPIRSY